MIVRALGIYEVDMFGRKVRLLATGHKTGILYAFRRCDNPTGPVVYYPKSKVTLLYEGNTEIADIDL